MKNIYFILTLLPLLFLSCSTRKIALTEDEIPEERFYLANEIKPFTGKCVIYFSGTKTIKEKMHFKDGVLNGEHTSYYKNGEVKRTGSYLNGLFHGKWIGFDKEGNKTYEVRYCHDELSGNCITWYSTGVIKERGCYKNNHRVNDYTVYDQAGMIIVQQTY